MNEADEGQDVGAHALRPGACVGSEARMLINTVIWGQ